VSFDQAATERQREPHLHFNVRLDWRARARETEGSKVWFCACRECAGRQTGGIESKGERRGAGNEYVDVSFPSFLYFLGNEKPGYRKEARRVDRQSSRYPDPFRPMQHTLSNEVIQLPVSLFSESSSTMIAVE